MLTEYDAEEYNFINTVISKCPLISTNGIHPFVRDMTRKTFQDMIYELLLISHKLAAYGNEMEIKEEHLQYAIEYWMRNASSPLKSLVAMEEYIPFVEPELNSIEFLLYNEDDDEGYTSEDAASEEEEHEREEGNDEVDDANFNDEEEEDNDEEFLIDSVGLNTEEGEEEAAEEVEEEEADGSSVIDENKENEVPSIEILNQPTPFYTMLTSSQVNRFRKYCNSIVHKYYGHYLLFNNDCLRFLHRFLFYQFYLSFTINPHW
jgi:hypothetical protein